MKLTQLVPVLCLAGLSHSAGAATLAIKCDTNQTGYPINPLIYSQFIEHLGRCIYGGIWAEMLEDRKFFFPITEEYAPYTSLTETEFPVVGASPWEIIGSADGVAMVREDSFVGDQTPFIKSGHGIQQHDLGVVQDMDYNGYIWLKAKGDKPATVEVTLLTDGDKVAGKPATFTADGRDYKKFEYSFKSSVDTDKATLRILVKDGDCYIGTLSLMPGDNIHGMRADTMQLLKELNAPSYRWPGGNFVSNYDWRDGIGDRDRRPPRANGAWTGVEHNDFGTDEFIDFCRILNTEPVIAANTGFGDHYSAAQWVEYCNAGAETIGGGWRAENGSEQPYGVKYWCVGNEMWGDWQMGYMHLDQYVMKHNRTARAMWDVDPNLVLVGSGDLNTRSVNKATKKERGWTEGMLQDCAPEYMDLISEHFYRGRLPWLPAAGNGSREEVDLQTHVGQIAESIHEIASRHRELQASLPNLEGNYIPISMDEWNYWHRDYLYGELGCRYDLADALGIANGFHEYYRNGDIVHWAFYAQTVNVIGAIKTTKTKAEFATTGLVLKLYRNHFGSLPLKLDGDYGNYGVSVALNDTGSAVTVAVVNPTDEAVDLDLQLAGAQILAGGKRWLVTGPSADAYNAPGEQRMVDLTSEDLDGKQPKLNVPALSVALFELPIK